MIKKRNLIICIFLTLILSSCSFQENSLNANSYIKIEKEKVTLSEKNDLKVPISYVKTKNPLLEKDKSLYFFNKLIFESLYDYTPEFGIEPVLAESMSISDDGRSITIKLKDFIKWQNQSNLNADDVVFTYNFIKFQYRNTIYKDLVETVFNNETNISSKFNIQKIDSKTVRMTFDKSYSQIKNLLTIPIINRKTSLNGKSNNSSTYALIAKLEYEFKVNGTGPYAYEDYSRLKNYNLKANESYWKSIPKIKKISGVIISTKEAALTTMLSGITDIVISDSLDWGKYVEDETLKSYEFADTQLDFIIYNHNKSIFQGEKGKILKLAISNSLEKNDIVSQSFLKHGRETASLIHPQKSNEIRNILGEQLDVSKIDEQMIEQGYKRNIETGYYTKNNQPFTLKIVAYGNKNKLKEVEIIEESVKKVGIKLIVDFKMDWEKFQNSLTNKQFDLALLTAKLPLNTTYKEILLNGGTLNFGNINDVDIENKMTEWIYSVPAKEELARDDLFNTVMKNQTITPIAYRNNAVLLNGRIIGDITPQSFNIFYGIENWEIK